MSKPVAYRFKSPLSEEGQWEYGKEPPVGSRWEIEGLYRVQVNVPRTPLEKAAKEMLQSVECMLRNGKWYQAQERADALRDALSQPKRAALAEPVQEPVTHTLNCVCGAVWDVSPDGVEEMVHAPTPPPRQWQGLTEEEMQNATLAMDAEPLAEGWSELVKFARSIEAKLREKNT